MLSADLKQQLEPDGGSDSIHSEVGRLKTIEAPSPLFFLSSSAACFFATFIYFCMRDSAGRFETIVSA